MIGMIRLYTKVRRSRSSAIVGIILGSPPDVPELHIPQFMIKIVCIKYKQKIMIKE